MEYSKTILEAVKQFSYLPGIGERTALRQTLYMAKWTPKQIEEFSKGISGLLNIKNCRECGVYSDEEVCEICLDESRKSEGVLCVVESVTDCIAIENSGKFKGLYQVLGRVLNPLMGIGPDQLGLDNFLERFNRLNVNEVILALNPSVEGDATCSFIKDMLPNDVKVDRIGFGIPIGGSLEYLDSMTISKALENKKLM